MTTTTANHDSNSTAGSTPAFTPGSLSLDRFIGFPISSFRVNERRSLTVHLEDAGMFDVGADGDANDSLPVWVGRYARFADAQAVADKLNATWRTAPQSTASEVLAFVSRSTASVLVAFEKLCDDAEQAAYHLSRHNERTRAAALDERIEQARAVIAKATSNA